MADDGRTSVRRKKAQVEKLLYGIPEVCEVLDLGRTKVCELLADGAIVSVKVGKRRLVPGPSLERFVSQLAASCPQDAA
jgi:excisionase family DNA binding protein